MKIGKWFKRFKSHISWITAVVAAGAAIASVCVTLNTLEEMRIDRNNAYMPELVFKEEVSPIHTKARIMKDAKDRIFVLNQGDDVYYDLTLLNIGVGVAKNVKIDIKEDDAINTAKWLKETFEYGEWMDITKKEGCFAFFYAVDADSIYGESTAGHDKEILYILPEAKQEYSLYIPDAYIGLVHKMYYICDSTLQLSIHVKWEDIQGKTYKKTYLLNAENSMGKSKANMDAIEENIKESSTGIYEDDIRIKVKEK